MKSINIDNSTMNTPSQTRRLLRQVKRNIQHYYAWLDEIRLAKHTPKTLFIWAHLASFVQTSRSIVTCIKHKHIISSSALLRMASDCIINCIIKIEKYSDSDCSVLEIKEKIKGLNKIILSKKHCSVSDIEAATKNKNILAKKLLSYDTSNVDSMQAQTVVEKWTQLELADTYQIYYSLLSEDIHCSTESIVEHHIDMNDSTMELDWYNYSDELAQWALSAILDFYKISERCFVSLSSILEANNSD